MFRLVRGQYLRGIVTDAKTRKPIPGAVVSESLLSRKSVKTDENGSYSLLLPLGEVWISAPGYVPVTIGTYETSTRSQNRNVALAKGAKLRATLVRPDGSPLAGRRVLFSLVGSQRAPFEWTAKTDAEGKVSTSSIGPSTRMVAYVDVDGVFTQFYRRTQQRNHDLGRVTVPADRILVGRVRAASNERVAGARVALFPSDSRTIASMRITYTDRVGGFRFDAVPNERMTMIVEAGTHGFATKQLGPKALSEPVEVRMPDGQEVSGTVLDPKGNPVSGAWVTCYSTSSSVGLPGPSSTNAALVVISDRNGRFRFRGLAKRSWTVTSRYLRDGVYWRATTSASPGTAIKLKSVRAQDAPRP